MIKHYFTITWQREGDPELLTCTGLTPELALYRLRAALRNSSRIIVHKVEHEGRKP
jgi:hypothetical protein